MINRVRLPILLVVSWTGEMNIPLSPCVPEKLFSRDGFSRPVPRQPVRSPYSGGIWCLLAGFLPSSASKPQGSSERALPWQVTMDQLICASLSHTHYWYEVGMLKVPAVVSICMYICMYVWSSHIAEYGSTG